MLYQTSGQAKLLRGRLNNGVKVQKSIGNVNRQHPIGLQMSDILLKGLACKQVHGHRVARKSVNDQNIKLLRLFKFKL